MGEMIRKWNWAFIVRNMAIAAITLVLSILTFSFFGNYSPPISILSIRVETPRIAAGDDLQLQYEVERDRRCMTRVERTFYDATEQRFVLQDQILEGGGRLGYEKYRTKVSVPAGMAVGNAIYRVTLIFQCNWWQNIHPIIMPMPDIHFEISGISPGVYRSLIPTGSLTYHL